MRALAAACLLLAAAGPSRAQEDVATACANEKKIFCPAAEDGQALKACLSKLKRGPMRRCRLALEGRAWAPEPAARLKPHKIPADTTLPPAPADGLVPMQATPAPASPAQETQAERRAKSAKSFLNVDLPRADGSGKVRLAGCPGERCLTVFVTPWCGYCRRAAPVIRGLKEFLGSKGIETRIVVGKDKLERLQETAGEYGPDTLIDPEGEFRFSGGVPHCFVSREGGEVLLARPGIGARETPEGLARRLGLP